jgi:cytochrome bd-type quinol oxidase subunit 1
MLETQMKRHFALTTLILVASLLSACWMMGDRGYRMEPVGMEKVGNQDQWSKKLANGGLIHN